MKVINVVGARPNFMKAAPVVQEMRGRKSFHQLLVHTGQHYNYELSDVFFKELGMPVPDIHLGVGSGSHAEQTAKIMLGFEKVLLEEKPDLVLVYGDINSTIAAALTASKMNIRIGHVEAGLRSFDWTMPEEVNRVLTDQLSDFLFTHSPECEVNLKKEHVKGKIFFVGNTMIDSLLKFKEIAKKSTVMERMGINKKFILLTMHRAANVDSVGNMKKVVGIVEEASGYAQVVFPIHPRTRNSLEKLGFLKKIGKHALVCNPLGYIDFMNLQMNALAVLTDSGGVQEETTVLGVPCLTLRENTERPVTVEKGTNTVVGLNRERIGKELKKISEGKGKKGKLLEKWDGKAAKRICDILEKVH